VGERTVAVEVSSVVRASDTSFQIRWLERTYLNGSLSRTDRWTGAVHLDIQPTITIRPGWPLRIIVNKDIILTPYNSAGE
jgi:type IV secretory pathway TrbF-like protein